MYDFADYYYTTLRNLSEINRKSIKEDYNKTLDMDAVREKFKEFSSSQNFEFSEDMKVPLHFLMAHHHKDMVEAETHYRFHVFVPHVSFLMIDVHESALSKIIPVPSKFKEDVSEAA